MNHTPRIPIKRSELKPGEVLCSYCTARCCRYFAFPIDRPETLEDLEYIRWFMLHDPVSIFVEDETWYIMVHLDCKHLLPDYRCGIYDHRPIICQQYSTADCEYDNFEAYDQFFETAEQIDEYTNARFNSPDTFRSRKPNGLPVIHI